MPGEGDDSILYYLTMLVMVNLQGVIIVVTADIVFDVDYNDRITILGCGTEDLDVIALDDGYGIKAKGVLEAILLDSQLDQAGIARIVSADELVGFN